MNKTVIDFNNSDIFLQNKFCFHDYYITYFEFDSVKKTLKIKIEDLDNQSRFANFVNELTYKKKYEITLINVSKIENKYEGSNESFFEMPNLLAELTFTNHDNKKVKLNFILNGIVMHYFNITTDKAEINIL